MPHRKKQFALKRSFLTISFSKVKYFTVSFSGSKNLIVNVGLEHKEHLAALAAAGTSRRSGVLDKGAIIIMVIIFGCVLISLEKLN